LYPLKAPEGEATAAACIVLVPLIKTPHVDLRTDCCLDPSFTKGRPRLDRTCRVCNTCGHILRPWSRRESVRHCWSLVRSRLATLLGAVDGHVDLRRLSARKAGAAELPALPQRSGHAYDHKADEKHNDEIHTGLPSR